MNSAEILLVTAFEPFGGETVNASQEVVKLLPERIGRWRIIKEYNIPVVFKKGAKAVISAAEKSGARAILCIGQAAKRSAITPEMVAINFAHATVPDNEGNRPQDQPILPGEKEACFSTMPIRQMATAMEAAGVDSRVSYSAGVYVCNDVYYRVMRHFENTSVKTGFIHIPVTPQQGSPSLAADEAARALIAAIEEIETD